MIIDTVSSLRPPPVPRPTQAKAPVPAPATGPARPRRVLLIAASGAYLAALIAVCLAIRFAGDRWWATTVLLLAPRWPLTVPLAVLWPWAAWGRRWGPIAITAVATWVVLVPIMGLRVSLPASGSAKAQIRLLSCNIHRQHLNTETFAAYVALVKPDVVALQGWSEVGHEGLFIGPEWDVRREGELLVASRYPIASVTPIEFEDPGDVNNGERGSAARFEITTPKGPVHLISLHLASPHAGLLSFRSDAGEKLSGNITRRGRESDRVLQVARGVQGPLLLAGDFNTPDDSPIFREHWGQFTDAFSARGSGFGYTYIIGHTQLRIDHILAGSMWRVVRCWTGPDVGAAHRPLVADVDGLE